MRHDDKRILPWFERDARGHRRMVVPERFDDIVDRVETCAFVVVEVVGIAVALLCFAVAAKLCLDFLLA